MKEKYGFVTEKYESGEIETLITGDGKAQFTDLTFDDGFVGIGFSYGRGVGIGTKEDYVEGVVSTDVGVKWQVKFDNQKSIDAMIETLLRVKNNLAGLE